jgi:RNA recognition motif-containing protein
MEKTSFSGNPPNTRVFLGNLSYEISLGELKAALADIAVTPEDVHVATDRETGRGRGFAFLAFKTLDDAKHAIAVLNGCRLGARSLRADYASARTSKTLPAVSHKRSSHFPPAASFDEEDDSRRRKNRR